MLTRLEDSVLVVIDLQPKFLAPIWESERVVERARFLVRCAGLLGVPVLATEQVPDKMGGTEPSITAALGSAPRFGKSAFSCWRDPGFRDALAALQRSQAVLVGIETHICVNQTAHDLMDEDFDVVLCGDGISARTEGLHEGGLARMRDEGAALANTESVVYEWMVTAGHPRFREILELVKSG